MVSFPLVSHHHLVHTSPSILATCQAHLILRDFITRKILDEEYRSLSSSLSNFLHSPVKPSLLGPKILNNLFSNTLSLCSSLNVSDQVSHSYKTTGKVIVLCILIFIFLGSKLEDKTICTEWQHAFPNFNMLLISSLIEFLSVNVFPKYFNSSIL
jgi:hypothetical protein